MEMLVVDRKTVTAKCLLEVIMRPVVLLWRLWRSV